jgi:hypothetical protein
MIMTPPAAAAIFSSFLQQELCHHLLTMPSALSQAITSEQWDHALTLVQSQQNLCKQSSTRAGFFEGIKNAVVLPIHEVCANPEAPFELVKALVDSYPESLTMKESAYERLPLHIACRKHAKTEVVGLILERYLDGSLVPDTLGRIPLHYALSNGAEDEIVDLLLSRSPNSARGFDRRGWYPLHVACSVGASAKVVEKILQCYPEACLIQTHKGTSVERCMDSHQAANKPEIYELLRYYRAQAEKSLGEPAKRPSMGRVVV